MQGIARTQAESRHLTPRHPNAAQGNAVSQLHAFGYASLLPMESKARGLLQLTI